MSDSNQDETTLFKSRRNFLRTAAALGGSGLLLNAGVTAATASSGGIDAHASSLLAVSTQTDDPTVWNATEDNILGPYHRARAPYRALITPPLAPGEIMVVKGRVWGLDTRRPLPGAVLDIWQADHLGSYDNDDPTNPPDRDMFLYRARLVTDETGYYEYQTIRPGRYLNGATYRPAHIHYMVRRNGYKPLITQLYFKDDPFNKTDSFIKSSLIIDPKKITVGGGSYEVGVFDIILENN